MTTVAEPEIGRARLRKEDRRLITGSGGEYYYTPDDYATFCQVQS